MNTCIDLMFEWFDAFVFKQMRDFVFSPHTQSTIKSITHRIPFRRKNRETDERLCTHKNIFSFILSSTTHCAARAQSIDINCRVKGFFVSSFNRSPGNHSSSSTASSCSAASSCSCSHLFPFFSIFFFFFALSSYSQSSNAESKSAYKHSE